MTVLFPLLLLPSLIFLLFDSNQTLEGYQKANSPNHLYKLKSPISPLHPRGDPKVWLMSLASQPCVFPVTILSTFLVLTHFLLFNSTPHLHSSQIPTIPSKANSPAPEARTCGHWVWQTSMFPFLRFLGPCEDSKGDLKIQAPECAITRWPEEGALGLMLPPTIFIYLVIVD